MSNVLPAKLEDVLAIVPDDPVTLQYLAQLMLYRAEDAVAVRVAAIVEELVPCLAKLEEVAERTKELDGYTSSYAGGVAAKLLTLHRNLAKLVEDAAARGQQAAEGVVLQEGA